MILASIETLVMGVIPSPSVVVLRPVAAERSNSLTERVIPIWIGAVEAAAIGTALDGIPHARPMTHDLCNACIEALGGSIDRVVITDVQGSTFFAQVVIAQDGDIVCVDARPSDALALALRWNAPIYLEEDVIERASYPYIFGGGDDHEAEIEEFHRFIENVTPDDFVDEEGFGEQKPG